MGLLELVRYLAAFASVFVALFAAHQVADHWVQTEYQAATKGLPGWVGRRACAAHVLTYTATGLVGLAMLSGAVRVVTGVPEFLSGWSMLAGLAVSGVTHYVADRRAPLARMAARCGHAEFHGLGRPRPGRDDNPSLGTGAYALDQSWHYGWLFVAALVAAA